MKRIIIISAIVIVVLPVMGLIYAHLSINASVIRNIAMAEKLYQGKNEDALISYMLDENNSFDDRTHLAIWTFGQIKSEKALPILKELYKNDPKGKTCKGKHDSVLCQYEIYKAIQKIETGRLFTYEKYIK
jgi:hypothetical protein